VILPALGDKKVVICDRFYDSSTAYQGWGRGINIGDINRINQIATLGLVPDITFLIDIQPDESVKRKRSMSGSDTDRMEGAGTKFYDQVRSGYLAIAESEPERFVIINGTRSIEKIEEEIWGILNNLLPGRI
jgi:dTMP kinase